MISYRPNIEMKMWTRGADIENKSYHSLAMKGFSTSIMP